MAIYNRYKSFMGEDGTVEVVPFIPIPTRKTDKYIYWESGNSRMDLISYQYYGDASYGWLILQANPELPSIEYLITNGTTVRVQDHLDVVITQYENDTEVYKQIEGNN